MNYKMTDEYFDYLDKCLDIMVDEMYFTEEDQNTADGLETGTLDFWNAEKEHYVIDIADLHKDMLELFNDDEATYEEKLHEGVIICEDALMLTGVDVEDYDDEFNNPESWGVETESLNEAISWNDLTWAEQYVADRVLNDIKYEHVSRDEEDIISYIYTIASDAEYECPEDEEFICDDEKVLDYILDHIDINETLKEGVNWREIKATLDNDKVDEVVRNISNIMNNAAKKNGLRCYLYRKKYRENWNSLLYMIFKERDDETLLNDKHYSNGDYDDETEKYIKSTLKPVLMDIKKNIPEVSSVGFVRGNDCGNVLGYINLPYENFTLN